MSVKYRVVMTCWDYKLPTKPYIDVLPELFESQDAASKAVRKCVADELETLNEGRTPVPVEDSDGNVVCYDYDFRADECGEHEMCIRFWDGYDYQDVTHYDIYPVDFLPDSQHSCTYRGFAIYSNAKHTRFKIEGRFDVCLTTRYSLQAALTWVDDFSLAFERVKGK